MYLVAYVMKDDELNLDTLTLDNARLGWIVKNRVVDMELAVAWLQHKNAVSYTSSLTFRSTDWFEQAGFIRFIMQQLIDEDVTQLHLAGEPLTLPIEQVDFFAPIEKSPSVVGISEKKGMGHLVPMLRSLAFDSDEQVALSLAWAILSATDGSLDQSEIGCTLSLRFYRVHNEREDWVLGPSLWLGDPQAINPISVSLAIGDYHSTFQTAPSDYSQWHQAIGSLQSGDMMILEPFAGPIILSRWQQLDWHFISPTAWEIRQIK